MNRSEVLFREQQRFTQPWIRVLIVVVAGLSWYGAIHQLVLRRPLGTNPAPDAALVVILLVFGVGLPLLFLLLRLETEVFAGGIRIRFIPFHRRGKVWHWQEIERIERRTYSPLLEYGGWGIRLGPKGWAYNVRGNQGIQLVLPTGKRILIGTQQPDAFMRAIEQARAVR